MGQESAEILIPSILSTSKSWAANANILVAAIFFVNFGIKAKQAKSYSIIYTSIVPHHNAF